MPSPVFGIFKEVSAFGLLGRLYPDPSSSEAFLVSLGLPVERLPTMTAQTSPTTYWSNVCRRIDDGISATVDLAVLARAAAAENPGSRECANLVKKIETIPGGGGHAAGPAGAPGAIRLLLLQAAPTDKARLRLGAEEREIATIAREQSPRQLHVTSSPATRTTDIIRALLEARPTIVHFAGHGEPDGSILFEDDAGGSQPVRAAALAAVFADLRGLECVVMNTCYLGRYADDLLVTVGTVIGSMSSIDDECALAFSRGFYRGLTHGETTAEAYRWGLKEMQLSSCAPGAMVMRSR